MSDRETITAIADAMFAFGRRMIRQHRDFYPFGAVVTGDGNGDGEVEIVSGDLGHPWSDAAEVTDLLWETLSARDTAVAGVAKHAGKAITVEIRPRDGPPLRLTQPYSRRPLATAVRFGPISQVTD